MCPYIKTQTFFSQMGGERVPSFRGQISTPLLNLRATLNIIMHTVLFMHQCKQKKGLTE